MGNSQPHLSGKREDITLLVRNFNFPLPNALKSPTAPSVRFNPNVQTNSLLTQNTDSSIESDVDSLQENRSSSTYETTTTSETYGNETKSREKQDSRIKAYVDFSEYYTNVEKRRKEGTLPDDIDF